MLRVHDFGLNLINQILNRLHYVEKRNGIKPVVGKIMAVNLFGPKQFRYLSARLL